MTLCGIDCADYDLWSDVDGRVYHADNTPHRQVRWTADRLMSAHFPDPRWAVPGLVPEGLALLVGGPKIGKSWLALNLAVAIASGERVMSKVDVAAGDVLYLALEDPPRRLQRRLATVLGDHAAPARLTLDTAAGRGQAATAHVRMWLENHPDARLVVIDVLAKVRPTNDGDDRYAADYRTGSAFKELADEYGVAVLVVHHTRKMRGDDFVDDISGTNGLAGAADTICLLRRARTEADAILSITGRDVDEAEHALKLTHGRWALLDGPATDYAVSETGQAILRFLRQRTDGATPKVIADQLRLDPATVRQTCRRMVDRGHLATNGRGTYTASHLSPVSPDQQLPAETGVTADPVARHTCHSPPEGSDSGDTRVTAPTQAIPQVNAHRVTTVTE